MAGKATRESVNLAIKRRMFEAMADMDMSYRDIAAESGVPKSTIGRMFCGYGASATSIVNMARFLGVSPAWLLGEQDERGTV